jgi:GNAT superfamily N-acetyltransferase
MTDLARRALSVTQTLLALGNEQFEAEGATFVRNCSFTEIRDANHVARVAATSPDEIDRLLERVEREFAGYPHRRFDLDLSTPPALEPRLAFEGYQRGDLLIMALEGDLADEGKPHDIRLVEDNTGWDRYAALHEIDWQGYSEDLPPSAGKWLADPMYRSRRVKSPPTRNWLAYVDGEARAYLTSWQGIDGVGQVEDLFTHPDFRHRGLATALIHRGVADCRERGAGPVVIVADPQDTPKQMYTAMGFRPVAMKREYWKNVAD